LPLKSFSITVAVKAIKKAFKGHIILCAIEKTFKSIFMYIANM